MVGLFTAKDLGTNLFGSHLSDAILIADQVCTFMDSHRVIAVRPGLPCRKARSAIRSTSKS